MKTFLRNNGLSLVLLAFFLMFWFFQSLAGHAVDNEERHTHHQPEQTYAQYLEGGHFWQATFENWESEFLQMAAYVVFTCCLFQKGSAESKDPDEKQETDENPEAHRNDSDAPGPVKKGGWQLKLYKNSLSLALASFFVLSFIGHAIGGAKEYSIDQMAHGEPGVTPLQFVRTADFWFQSMQNWQSEFLAVFSIVVLSIWLRQHGSPESKPVHAPHSQTGD
jgi:hypothetical protein